MSKIIKLKYKVNYNDAIFNYKTQKYESKEATYCSLREAKAHQLKCQKCQSLFGTLKKLAIHKKEYHSY